MALTNETVARVTVARARMAGSALLSVCALALALGACGSSSHSTTRFADSELSAGDADPAARAESSSSNVATAPSAATERDQSKAIAATVTAAQRAYHREARGSKLRRETARIARDEILLSALGRGDVAAAQAEADAQLRSAANHLAHVTRISVTRAQRVLVNATLNSDGTFVVAPARSVLQLNGRRLGTLLVSIQDVTGFVKLVHRTTLADVVVRGASGQVRASLASAAGVQLPLSGDVGIAGRTYAVRSFRELGWGNEALTVWILEGDHPL
jgi:hypothetical protein